MREAMSAGWEGKVEKGDVYDFEKTKKEMINYLEGELRRVSKYVIANQEGLKMQKERADYFNRIISDLKGGSLSSAREFFAARKTEKEEAVAGAAAVLRRTAETNKSEKENLLKKIDEAIKSLEDAKEQGDRKRAVVESDKIASLKTDVAIIESLEEERRGDLEKMQDDPDLESFTRFVAAIDAELEKNIRKV